MASNNNKNKKFLFDLHDFQREEDEAKERRKYKAPPAPTFSLDDMEAARKASFEDGREKGLEMATDSIAQRTELVVQSLVDTIRRLEIAEDRRSADFIDNSVAISYRALKKLLPAVLDLEKERLIQQALYDFFAEQTPKVTLALSVHGTMVESITKYASMLSPSLSVQADDTLSPAQARMEWMNGAFDFTPDRLVEQILQAVGSRVKPADESGLDGSEKTPHNEETATDDKTTIDQDDNQDS